MINDSTPDQTQFAAESPFYEKEELEPMVPNQIENENNQQNKFKKYFLVGGGVFFVLVIGLAVRARSLAKIPEDKANEEVPTALTEVVAGPFNQRLSELVKELETADPNQDELPFPPVAMEISLEEK